MDWKMEEKKPKENNFYFKLVELNQETSNNIYSESSL